MGSSPCKVVALPAQQKVAPMLAGDAGSWSAQELGGLVSLKDHYETSGLNAH